MQQVRRTEEAITRFTRAVRKASRDQRGLTLIEVLVVITILGILAAIISISLLGVTSTANNKARQAEFATVQSAFDAMLADQSVDPVTNAALQARCVYTPGTSPGAAIFNKGGVAGAGQDMTTWPVNNPYVSPNTSQPTALSTHYTRDGTTKYGYACDTNGNVVQSDGTTVRQSPNQ